MSQKASLRAKTVSIRRQHILEAAVSVFAERGFHRSTIRDVAVAAGVSDGAIYNVFANKQALLLGMLDPLGETTGAASPPPDDLAGLLHQMIEQLWTRYTPHLVPMLQVVLSEVLVDRELRVLFVERVIAPVLTLPKPLLQRLVTRREMMSVDIEMTVRLMVGSFLGLLLLRMVGDDWLEARATGVPDALADFLSEGLRPRQTKGGGDALQ